MRTRRLTRAARDQPSDTATRNTKGEGLPRWLSGTASYGRTKGLAEQLHG